MMIYGNSEDQERPANCRGLLTNKIDRQTNNCAVVNEAINEGPTDPSPYFGPPCPLFVRDQIFSPLLTRGLVSSSPLSWPLHLLPPAFHRSLLWLIRHPLRRPSPGNPLLKTTSLSSTSSIFFDVAGSSHGNTSSTPSSLLRKQKTVPFHGLSLLPSSTLTWSSVLSHLCLALSAR